MISGITSSGGPLKRTALAIAAALLLTGCAAEATEPQAQESLSATPSPSPSRSATSAKPAPTPKPTKKPSPKPTPTPVASTSPSSDELFGASSAAVDDVFIDQITGAQPTLNYKDIEGMITIGKSFCTMYDNGATSSRINEFILGVAGVAYTVPELVAMHGAGVGAFCPEHVGKVGAS